MAKTYESYKDSGVEWIGEIPEGWEVLALKRIFKIIAGATPKSENEAYWDGDIAWITPADYKTEQKYVSFGRRNLSEQGYHACSTVLLPKGSIVFSKRAPIGLVAITERELCTNQGCLGCVPIRDVSNVFMYYLLSVYTEQFELYGSGTTFKEISANNFANFKLMLPPLSEQQAIASFLDTKCGEIDSLISLQEEMISELQAYKQSVITEAVTKGLDPNAKMNCCASREKNDACISSSETQPAIERKFKDSGVEWIGEIPETWKYAKLKNIINYIESGVSVNAGLEEVGPNDIGVLKTSSVSKNVFIPYECKKVFENEINRVSCPVKANTIIVSRMNTPELVGACGYVDRDYDNIFLPDRLWQVHFIESVYVKYYWYYLISKRTKSYFSSLSSGTSSSMQNISQPQFQGAPIAVPPLSEQQAIASYLDDKTSQIDSLISLKQQKIDELKSYKKSIIYEYVTGKKRV